jgi:predicted acetyltransferase
MIDLITRHQAQVEKGRFLHLPVNHPLRVLLASQYQEFKLKPLTMGRIVDVESLFPSLKWPQIDGRLTIQVSDRHGSWNDDVFTMTFEAGKCTVTRGGARPDIELGIQQLTQLVVGFTDVRTLALGNKLAIHDKHQLADNIFPQGVPYFIERF